MQTRKLLELIGEINMVERDQRADTSARLGKLETENAELKRQTNELRELVEALIYNLREAKR